MASGSLTLASIGTDGSLTLTFTPGTDFDSGVLNIENTRTGVTTTQAVVSGLNTVAALTGSVRYIFFVESYDDTPAYLGTSNHLLVTTPANINVAAWPVVQTQWRTDRIDWQTVNSTIGDDERLTIPTNSRGYWYQQKFSCTEQNARIIIHGMKLNVRIKGRGEEARSA